MLSRTPIDPPSICDRGNLGIVQISRSDIPALNALALSSLFSLFDEKKKLFSKSVTLTETGLRRQETSAKLSAIALMGLQNLAVSGATHPLDILSIQDTVWKDRSWVKSLRDLGLLTWFIATCIPDRLQSLFDEYDFSKAISMYPDGREAQTIGLAWFLTGIAHARLACPSTAPDLTDVAVQTYRLLQENQAEGGIFGHAACPKFFQRAFSNRFGTFADQIYAIYALTTFARAFQVEEPLGSALSCGNSIRALQGELGQWWSRYDKYSCRVVNRYPVYSSHQDGTAPVGFLALGDTTGQSFHEPVYKGLSWIAGANELGCDLRSIDRNLIWDSVEPRRRIAHYWETALSLMKISPRPQESLRIRFEARPDHFGWLLYAFGRFGLANSRLAAKAVAAH